VRDLPVDHRHPAIAFASHAVITLRRRAALFTVLSACHGCHAGSRTPPETPPVQVPSVGGARVIAASNDGTWAAVDGGTLYYWGLASSVYNDSPTARGHLPPSKIAAPAPIEKVQGVTATSADDWACVLDAAGAVTCFGLSGDGFSGKVNRTWPIAMHVNGKQIVASSDFGCALGVDGTVQCWESSTDEFIFGGTSVTSFAPTKVAGLSGVVGISGRFGTLFARAANGSVRGGEILQMICDEKSCGPRQPPAPIPGLSNVLQVEGSLHAHACALLQDKTVACWGVNTHGQLGIGTKHAASAPTAVPGLSDVVEIAVGRAATCARHSDGSVQCWGENNHGQLGDGTTDDRLSPVRVTGLTGAKGITVGATHACAIVEEGKVRCWGGNEHGETGTNPPQHTAPISK
jgi:hypothetical protein